ncbi:hypothetical protein [Altericista sp. CCNU0014]|uniref:hypothetical protein n=1 Tax=Altericista sp. CCNU0014 TaxID=3082949 RepID=UPI00384BB2C4
MNSLNFIESRQDRPQQFVNTSLDGYTVKSHETLILIVCIIFALSWVVNKLISSNYKGSFQFKDRDGTRISAEITPPEKEE